MADGNKAALERQVFRRTVHCALEADAGDAGGISQHLVQGHKGLELDLAGGNLVHQLVDQDGLGLELVTAVYQVDLLGDVRQVQRLFDGGIAAADHAADFFTVEKAVAGGAAGNAAAHEGGLRRQAQVLGGGASGQNQAVTGVGVGIALERERAAAQIHRVDVVEHNLGLEALGVLQKTLHQFRALHAVDVGRPVVYFGGGHELAALGDACHQHGAQVGAGGVDGGGVAGRAGAQNQDLGVFGCGHNCFQRRGAGAWRMAPTHGSDCNKSCNRRPLIRLLCWPPARCVGFATSWCAAGDVLGLS